VDRNVFDGKRPIDGLFIRADISDPNALETVYGQANAFSNVLDAVINNAALQVCKPLLETTVEEWDEVMASNLRSVFLGAHLAYPLLKMQVAGQLLMYPLFMPLQPRRISLHMQPVKGGCWL